MRRFAVIATFLAITTLGTLYASPLNLILGPPDVFSVITNASYDPGTGLLQVHGTPLGVDGFSQLINPATSFFDVFATIDNTTGNLSGGTFSASGEILAPVPAPFATLASGNITGFGFDALGGTLEFLVANDGSGTLPYGLTIGLIMSQLDLPAGAFGGGQEGFSGLTNICLSNNCLMDAGNVAVPEPSSIALALTGAGLLVALRRRKSSIKG